MWRVLTPEWGTRCDVRHDPAGRVSRTGWVSDPSSPFRLGTTIGHSGKRYPCLSSKFTSVLSFSVISPSTFPNVLYGHGVPPFDAILPDQDGRGVDAGVDRGGDLI